MFFVHLGWWFRQS